MLIEIYDTTDASEITRAVTSPNNLPWAFQSHDDPKAFYPAFDGFRWIGIKLDHQFAGVVLLRWINEQTSEIHIALLPSAYGHTRDMGKIFMHYIGSMVRPEKQIDPASTGISRNFSICLYTRKVG